jgi:hypothetical protein
LNEGGKKANPRAALKAKRKTKAIMATENCQAAVTDEAPDRQQNCPLVMTPDGFSDIRMTGNGFTTPEPNSGGQLHER